MMRVVCCVCLETYGTKPGPNAETHGFCPSCHIGLMDGRDYRDIRRDLIKAGRLKLGQLPPEEQAAMFPERTVS